MDRLMERNMVDWMKPNNLELLRPDCEEPLQKWFNLPDSSFNLGTGCTTLWTQSRVSKSIADALGLGNFRVGCLFHFLFRPTPLLRKVAAQRLPGGLDRERYVGGHVRLGDGSMMKGEEQQIEDIAPKLRSLLAIASGKEVRDKKGRAVNNSWFKSVQQQRLPIMVFTDSVGVKRLATNSSWLKTEGIQRAIQTATSVRGGVFQPQHSDKKHRYTDSFRKEIDDFYNTMADVW